MTSRPALSHMAFACRDLEETHRFYTEIMGFKLLHTEVATFDKGWFKHVFYDLGDGSAIAFFDLHGVGEPSPMRTEISTGLDLPLWVNHFAVRATEASRDAVLARLEAAGGKPLMTIDHGWLLSTYLLDPNGIMVELAIDAPGVPDEPEEALRLLAAGPEAAGAEKAVTR